MSELASAVGATAATEVTQLSDDQLREDLVALPEQLAALKAAWLKRVRECERRQLHQADGHRSAGAWLRAHALVSGREASSAAWLARRLSRLPVTLAAFESAQIGESHVRQIALLANDVPMSVMSEGEAQLVEAARHTDASAFRGLIDKLRAQWIPEATAKSRDDAYDRRRLDFGEQFAGLVPVDGLLDPLTAEKLQVVTNALSTPDPAEVPAEARRTPTQRRHDALDEALSRLLDQGELPTVRRERPHIEVTVELTELLTGAGTAELEWSGSVDLGVAEMVLCDARLHALASRNGAWQALEIVEEYDTVSRRLWRYLRLRDRGCRFPGCDQPAVWTDAHHIVWRSKGGATSNGNCVLLCRYHHRLIHRTHRPWVVEGDPDATLRFISPTGQVSLSPVPRPPRCR